MERIDDLQLSGLRLIQDTELFCFGTDAVLLADFADIGKGSKVVDLGTASGILPILMYGRQPEAYYKGIEIQIPLAELAERNVELNKVKDHIEIVRGDIKDAPDIFGTGYDVVVANPPYEKEGEGAARDVECHKIARKELLITFAELCGSASKLLRTGGKFYIIHKACRLPELFGTLRNNRLEPKLMRQVHSHAGDEAKYVLICSVKDAGEFMRVLPPLVLHEDDGAETRELKRIYNR